MKKMTDVILRIFMRIKLVDKFLLLIMVILISQSVYSIFGGNIGNEFTASIDVFIRTTIAAIFGYFISANFIKNETSNQNIKMQDDCDIEIDIEECKKSYHLQIFIVGAICIVSILIMLMARNYMIIDNSLIPTITQFRDIISASVGFFLGIPTSDLPKNCKK